MLLSSVSEARICGIAGCLYIFCLYIHNHNLHSASCSGYYQSPARVNPRGLWVAGEGRARVKKLFVRVAECWITARESDMSKKRFHFLLL